MSFVENRVESINLGIHGTRCCELVTLNYTKAFQSVSILVYYYSYGNLISGVVKLQCDTVFRSILTVD